MMLLPVVVRGRAVALLYADWDSTDVTSLTSNETYMLKDLVHEIEIALHHASPVPPIAAAG
jgi:hypothetical protein